MRGMRSQVEGWKGKRAMPSTGRAYTLRLACSCCYVPNPAPQNMRDSCAPCLPSAPENAAPPLLPERPTSRR